VAGIEGMTEENCTRERMGKERASLFAPRNNVLYLPLSGAVPLGSILGKAYPSAGAAHFRLV